MPDEKKAASYLDDDERFGFMRRDKPSMCRDTRCLRSIAAGEPRLFDNTNKKGPYCIGCSRIAAGIVDSILLEAADVETLIKRLDRLEAAMPRMFGGAAGWAEHCKSFEERQQKAGE